MSIPEEFAPRDVIGTVTVSHRTIPIGHIKFKLAITKHPGAELEAQPTGESATHYYSAFASYASQDRQEVLKRVQMLELLGIDSFQDVLDLDPGARWERELYRQIDSCDVFLLFWSRAAKSSERVRREARYALSRQSGDETAPPEIKPIILEQPVELPWEELSHLHFNDQVSYLIAGDLSPSA